MGVDKHCDYVHCSRMLPPSHVPDPVFARGTSSSFPGWVPCTRMLPQVKARMTLRLRVWVPSAPSWRTRPLHHMFQSGVSDSVDLGEGATVHMKAAPASVVGLVCLLKLWAVLPLGLLCHPH